MSEKLGFTFYPKDWWTSESYFELTPIQRYYYLECLFIMYSNDGCMKTQKTQFENRIRTEVLQSDWDIIITKFDWLNDMYTHKSVNKRLRKAIANRENGKKGGRPPKEIQEPKKPNNETQKNPPLEREREYKDNINIDWEKLLNQFNKITGKNAKVINQQVKNKILARLKEGYSKQDLLNAIENCFNDPYHKETNHKYLTLEFISRTDKMEKYSTIKSL